MTSKALATALVACALSAAACGATANGASTGSVQNGGFASPAKDTAADFASPAKEAGTDSAPPAASPAAGTNVQAKVLSGKVVVIDPGHNGGNYRDTAAINKKVNVLTQWKACDTTGTSTNDDYSEAAFTWDVSQRLAKILKSRGATVKLTRTDNTGVGPCITQRAAIGNKAKADAAISIHADGAPAADHGFHVIMPKKIKGPVDPVVGASKRLGVDVRDAFRSGTGIPYSTYIGSKALNYRSDLGGLNLSTVPKIFIECGNMRNAKEAAEFQRPAFRQKIALSLANGLQNYLK
ncbi:N-acetylmuramoyl-L-alanine amidase [Streptosporangium lutulentum]|uniref:N-acetylmuramoyl-L-alanine amidase n=1 Tax=Streptosporangium lutulentum TaxID=1461250 RepID=A0ABT9QNR1_9ACTN|nr:N-acetylmuramoyl-L-alanine amidase [Streptosporangium lutulentum]MDP9848399.1 N-acetylmuramoyl-L-alanine amidase [Streptosporangium lutulentum]